MGHTKQKEYFERMIAAGSVAHAFLLHGPQGVGKRMFANELASKLLSDATVPLAHNPDFVSLQPGVSKDTGKQTDISIESIHDMKLWAYQRPMYGARKVVLIDDAERLSIAAANALLKVLEEPPAYMHFMLVSSRSGQLMETIASRCQDVAFALLSEDELERVLSSSHLNDADRALVVSVAAGKPGTALRLIEEQKLSSVTTAIADLQAMMTAGVTERIVYAKSLADAEDPVEVVSWWLSWMHAQLRDDTVSDARKSSFIAAVTGLLELAAQLQESKYNKRLAIEKFLLELPPSA